MGVEKYLKKNTVSRALELKKKLGNAFIYTYLEVYTRCAKQSKLFFYKSFVTSRMLKENLFTLHFFNQLKDII